MKNLKVISQENLLYNLSQFEGKKICAMVKSNAYGHGMKEIVQILKDKVYAFGVVNVEEGAYVRRLCDNPVVVCAKVENFLACKRHGLEFIVDDEADLISAVKAGLKNSLHLKINCGMDRFGVGSAIALRQINTYLQEKDIKLRSISTHFPQTENRRATLKNYSQFLALKNEISQPAEVSFGGSGIFNYDFDYQILRLGIGMYGYGGKGLKGVMRLHSYVKKVFFAKSGENIGYGSAYSVSENGYFAIISVGYGDGLRRNLSGRFCVKINGKKYHAVGNICMDCFFAKVDKTVAVGDIVEVFWDAEEFAKKCDTISYEILTCFSNFRGKMVIE